MLLQKQDWNPPQFLLQLRTGGSYGSQGPQEEFPVDLSGLSFQMRTFPLTTSILQLQMPTHGKNTNWGPPIVLASIALRCSAGTKLLLAPCYRSTPEQPHHQAQLFLLGLVTQICHLHSPSQPWKRQLLPHQKLAPISKAVCTHSASKGSNGTWELESTTSPAGPAPLPDGPAAASTTFTHHPTPSSAGGTGSPARPRTRRHQGRSARAREAALISRSNSHQLQPSRVRIQMCLFSEMN